MLDNVVQRRTRCCCINLYSIVISERSTSSILKQSVLLDDVVVSFKPNMGSPVVLNFIFLNATDVRSSFSVVSNVNASTSRNIGNRTIASNSIVVNAVPRPRKLQTTACVADNVVVEQL